MSKSPLRFAVVSAATTFLSIAGFTSAASAATLAVATATSTAVVGTTGTNATPITVSATVVTGGTSNQFVIDLPQGWTFVNPGNGSGSTCPDGITTTGINGITSCNTYVMNGLAFSPIQISSTFAAGQPVSVTYPANSLNVGANRNFRIKFVASNVTIDSGTATLAGGITNATVTFNANGGSGTMTDQTGSAAAALTANSFTREGYTFAGWATEPGGGGTRYADGASYPFTASTTLYAQWTPVLASTGSNAAFLSPVTVAFAGLGALAVAARVLLRRKYAPRS